MSSERRWIEIPGTPVAQPRHRVSSRGGFARVYLPKRHPVHEYKRRIAEGTKHWPVFVGPVAVHIVAVFPMPKSWSKTKKTEALAVEYHEQKPDPDNIGKAILDALSEHWRDDCHVADLRVKKLWTNETEGFTLLEMWELT